MVKTQERLQIIIVSGHSSLHHNRCLFLRTWCWKDT